jgi:hypothetical protein
MLSYNGFVIPFILETFINYLLRINVFAYLLVHTKFQQTDFRMAIAHIYAIIIIQIFGRFSSKVYVYSIFYYERKLPYVYANNKNCVSFKKKKKLRL